MVIVYKKFDEYFKFNIKKVISNFREVLLYNDTSIVEKESQV